MRARVGITLISYPMEGTTATERTARGAQYPNENYHRYSDPHIHDVVVCKSVHHAGNHDPVYKSANSRQNQYPTGSDHLQGCYKPPTWSTIIAGGYSQGHNFGREFIAVTK